MPGALVGSSLENIFVDPLNANFTSRDGVLFTKRDDLVAYPNGRNGVEATISGTVRSILEGAFYKVPGLRQLFFDTTDGLKNIVTVGENGAQPAYNLAGQRVSDSYKGVVITNGKKVVR